MIESKPAKTSTTEFNQPRLTFWHLASVFGIAVVLLVSLLRCLGAQPLQYRSLWWLALAAVLVPITNRFVFPKAWSILFRHRDLMVPFGIAWFLSEALGWLSGIQFMASLLSMGSFVKFFGIALNISVFTALDLCIWSAYAAWQIGLIWQVVRNDRLTDISPWRIIGRGFWRAMLTLIFGIGILLLAMIPAIGAGMIGVLILGIVWNVLTVALMPVVLSGTSPVLQSLKTGISKSWALKRHWWIQLLVVLVILGMVTYVKGTYQSLGSSHSNISLNVTAFWAGSFDNHFRWHSKYMAAIKTAPLPIAVALLQLLFITVAVSMKVHVIRILHLNEQKPKQYETG